jgi:hypothetical protein
MGRPATLANASVPAFRGTPTASFGDARSGIPTCVLCGRRFRNMAPERAICSVRDCKRGRLLVGGSAPPDLRREPETNERTRGGQVRTTDVTTDHPTTLTSHPGPTQQCRVRTAFQARRGDN